MLEVRNLAVRYGHHVALAGVSAKVGKGEICVVLGANGAGKSSMLKAVAGMVKPEPGSAITMNGRSIAGMKPHLIVEEGIALVPEGRGIFGDLTVAENLKLGAFAKRARQQEAATLDYIYSLFPRLAERKGQIARTMSGGEQQMVAIGRALMSKPDILMLDEPSLGLSPLLSKELFKSLAAVAASGVGVLLVEQNARLSLKIAARGYLIENGAITGEDSAAALMRDPAVVNAYLGGGPGAGGRGRPGSIRLPSGFALPSGLQGISRAIGDLAARAGAIQNAFTRALRRENTAPSAFVGRYDAAKEPDPWATVGAAGSEWRPNQPGVSSHASKVATEAEALAARAAERLGEHVRMSRLNDGRAPVSTVQIAAGTPPKPADMPSSPRMLLGPSAAAARAEPPAKPTPQGGARALLGPSAQPPATRRDEQGATPMPSSQPHMLLGPSAAAPSTRPDDPKPVPPQPAGARMLLGPSAQPSPRSRENVPAVAAMPAQPHALLGRSAEPPSSMHRTEMTPAGSAGPRMLLGASAQPPASRREDIRAAPAMPAQPRMLLGRSALPPAHRQREAVAAAAAPALPRTLLGASAQPPAQREAAAGVKSQPTMHRRMMLGPSAGLPARAAVRQTTDEQLDAAALAEAAAERLAAHMRSRRKATTTPHRVDEAPAAGAKHPLIGHNSAGARIEDETAQPAPVPRNGRRPAAASGQAAQAASAKPAGTDDPGVLAARAAAISAAHVANRRKALSVRVYPARAAAGGSDAAAPHKNIEAAKAKPAKEAAAPKKGKTAVPPAAGATIADSPLKTGKAAKTDAEKAGRTKPTKDPAKKKRKKHKEA